MCQDGVFLFLRAGLNYHNFSVYILLMFLLFVHITRLFH